MESLRTLLLALAVIVQGMPPEALPAPCASESDVTVSDAIVEGYGEALRADEDGAHDHAMMSGAHMAHATAAPVIAGVDTHARDCGDCGDCATHCAAAATTPFCMPATWQAGIRQPVFLRIGRFDQFRPRPPPGPPLRPPIQLG